MLDLLTHMMHYDPAKRITCAEAMEHPFFQELLSNRGSSTANEGANGGGSGGSNGTESAAADGGDGMKK